MGQWINVCIATTPIHIICIYIFIYSYKHMYIYIYIKTTLYIYIHIYIYIVNHSTLVDTPLHLSSSLTSCFHKQPSGESHGVQAGMPRAQLPNLKCCPQQSWKDWPQSYGYKRFLSPPTTSCQPAKAAEDFHVFVTLLETCMDGYAHVTRKQKMTGIICSFTVYIYMYIYIYIYVQT